MSTPLPEFVGGVESTRRKLNGMVARINGRSPGEAGFMVNSSTGAGSVQSVSTQRVQSRVPRVSRGGGTVAFKTFRFQGLTTGPGGVANSALRCREVNLTTGAIMGVDVTVYIRVRNGTSELTNMATNEVVPPIRHPGQWHIVAWNGTTAYLGVNGTDIHLVTGWHALIEATMYGCQ